MATLTGDPNVAFKNTIRGLETSDPVHPSVNNPTWQDLINNDAVLKGNADAALGRIVTLEGTTAGFNSRITTLEGQNLSGRITALEGQNLNGRLGVLEGQNLSGRITTLEGQNLDGRIANLEATQRFFLTPPPLSAAQGSLWLVGAYTLIKVSPAGAAPALWRTQQPYVMGLSFTDQQNANQDTYRDLALSSSHLGLTVLRGIPLAINLQYSRAVSSASFCSLWYKVPVGATLGANGNPTAGNHLFSYTGGADGDEIMAQTVYGQPDLLPGERLWIKLGMQGSGGNHWASITAFLTLELQQS